MSRLQKKDTIPGRVFDGQFRIRRRLGAGGMGVVYLADQIGVERPAVVKVIRSELSEDETARHRFQREARAVGRLNHPSIVQIYTMGTSEAGELYLAMEFVDGYPLSDLRNLSRPLPEWRVLNIAAQILGALTVAHGAKVVHRDLKPENVMLTDKLGRQDQVKVLDFGLVRMLGDATIGLTKTGEVAGTPRYMSPEQALGHPVDHLSDIYSLGMIIYELLIGRPPWEPASPVQYLRLHAHEPLPPLSERAPEVHLDPRTEQLVMRCVQKDPSDRYPSTAEALADAEAILKDLSRPPPPNSERMSARRKASAEVRGVSTEPAPVRDLDAETLGQDPASTQSAKHAGRRLSWRTALTVLAVLAALIVVAWKMR